MGWFVIFVDKASLIGKANDAIEKNNLNELKELVDQGMDINMVDTFNQSLLWYVCNYKRLEMAKWLLERGIDVNHAREKVNETPLMAAACANLEFTKLFVDAGAHLHAVDHLRHDAAFYSLIHRKEDVFHFLMNAGTDINTLFLNKDGKFFKYFDQPFVFQMIHEHQDLLTPENLRTWKALRLKNVFEQ